MSMRRVYSGWVGMLKAAGVTASHGLDLEISNERGIAPPTFRAFLHKCANFVEWEEQVRHKFT